MRISIQLNYAVDFYSSLSQISEFEREGLDFVWAAEAYRLDSPTFMGYLATPSSPNPLEGVEHPQRRPLCAALREIRRQLNYKCSWCGSELWVTDRGYPSSKLCFLCRMKNVALLRSACVFRCEHCGLVIDRELNAAKNLAA